MRAWFVLALLALFLTACENNPAISEKNNNGTSKSHINVQHRKSKAKSLSDVNAELGAGYISNGNYEKALVKLQKAVKFDSNNGTAFNYLGILYWRLEKNILAEKNFKTSMQKSPYDASISHNYASFLCAQKHYKRSILMFAKVFKNPLYDRLADAYQRAGNCALKIPNYKEANKLLRQALKLESKNAAALLGMAKLFYQQKNYKLSAYYFDRFSRNSRHSPDSLWLGINLERKLGGEDNLSSYILTLKNLYPDSRETLMLIQEKQGY